VESAGVLLGVDEGDAGPDPDLMGEVVDDLPKPFQMGITARAATRADHEWCTDRASAFDHDPQVTLKGDPTFGVASRPEIHRAHVGTPRIAADQVRLFRETELKSLVREAKADHAVGE
jgi:hypothetical protein